MFLGREEENSFLHPYIPASSLQSRRRGRARVNAQVDEVDELERGWRQELVIRVSHCCERFAVIEHEHASTHGVTIVTRTTSGGTCTTWHHVASRGARWAPSSHGIDAPLGGDPSGPIGDRGSIYGRRRM
jgi:hypothetical protein